MDLLPIHRTADGFAFRLWGCCSGEWDEYNITARRATLLPNRRLAIRISDNVTARCDFAVEEAVVRATLEECLRRDAAELVRES